MGPALPGPATSELLCRLSYPGGSPASPSRGIVAEPLIGPQLTVKATAIPSWKWTCPMLFPVPPIPLPPA